MALMDNAISISDGLKLEVGVPLNEEQLALLDRDIVWMEKVVVEGKDVLVPGKRGLSPFLVPNPYIAIPTWVLDTSINYESNGLDAQNTVIPGGLGNPLAPPILQRTGAGVSIFNTIQSVDNYGKQIDTLEQKKDATNTQELQNIYNNNSVEIKKSEIPQINFIKVNP